MPTQESSNATDQYSSWMGLIYIFNLIVGTGALTLPAVFARAGWALGLALIIVLAIISFITVTFVIETMACANAVLHWRRLGQLKRDRSIQVTDMPNELSEEESNSSVDSLENQPLFSNTLRFYELDHQVELGEMATLFFNTFGRSLFYIFLCIYLYGDLSIYCAAVAESLVDVICSSVSQNDTALNITSPCWDVEHSVSRISMYRICISLFVLCLGPFAFFNVQKTKYLQMLTSLFRWIAFSVMIGIASYRLLTIGPQGHPPPAVLTGIPGLFGACVYSFMCHHSIPSLIAPITKKDSLQKLLSADYTLICVFYLVLALTGSFAFSKLEDLYTLNFIQGNFDSYILIILEYFLALFPVFTLSTSFPVIAITLRNNLQTLFLDHNRIDSYSFPIRRICFPLMAIVPPLLISLGTNSLSGLVAFTGSYAGTAIQYLVPIFLVYSARKHCANITGLQRNPYTSPFKSNIWLICVLLWSIACIILVSVNLFAPQNS